MRRVTLELDRISNMDVEALAERIPVLVRSQEDRLRGDFPLVVGRYADADTARRTLRDRLRAIRDRGGEFDVFAVRYGGETIGLATFDQRPCVRRHGWRWFGFDEELVRGPMLACWLGSIDRPGGLLPQILRLAAERLVTNSRLRGHAWTLVRPGHRYVRYALAEQDNGFGGFMTATEPRDFSRVDGVTTPRILYIARHEVDELRI